MNSCIGRVARERIQFIRRTTPLRKDKSSLGWSKTKESGNRRCYDPRPDNFLPRSFQPVGLFVMQGVALNSQVFRLPCTMPTKRTPCCLFPLKIKRIRRRRPRPKRNFDWLFSPFAPTVTHIPPCLPGQDATVASFTGRDGGDINRFPPVVFQHSYISASRHFCTDWLFRLSVQRPLTLEM